MRLLFLTPQLPYPPRQGTSIRNFHLIDYLARRHTVDLLTFLAPGDALTSDSPLHHLCGRIAAVAQPQRSIRRRLRDLLTSPLPDMALRLESAEMHARVQAWMSEAHYDIVQVEGIELAQYVRHVDRRTTKIIFDEHNCEYLLQQRNALTDLKSPRRWHAAAYSLVQWAKLRRYEAAACRAADAVLAVSAPDRSALGTIAPQAAIHVISNGIDLAAYPATPQPSPPATPDGPLRLVFTGKMDYRPNIDAMLWFAQEVMPLLTATGQPIQLQIVGMNPHARLEPLRQNPAIEITGAVADPRPYIAAADIYVIPMRVGGGTRFKALEAMAAAKAIVSTTLGVEGIGLHHEQEVLLADTPGDFAAAILRLAQDRASGGKLAAALGKRARAFVATGHTWDRILPALEELYANVVSSK